MRHPDYEIDCLLDFMKFNVLLQTLATAFLSGATVEFAAHNYWVAFGAAVIGIAAYYFYEQTPTQP